MPAAPEWRPRLERSRAGLLALLDGVSQETLVRRPPGEPTPQDERWPARDVLWHVGEHEERWQRWIRAARAGRALDGFNRRPRPARVNTLPLLLDWLTEARAGTYALLDELAPLDAEAMAQPRPGPRDREMSFDDVLELLVGHDSDHATQIREVLALSR